MPRALDEMEASINEYNVQRVIVALDKMNLNLVNRSLAAFSEKDVEVKLVPETFQILSGSVKSENVLAQC